jgi:signal transduction histidine kinase
MQDRVDALDGSLTVDSVTGRGTRVIGRVPVKSMAALG